MIKSCSISGNSCLNLIQQFFDLQRAHGILQLTVHGHAHQSESEFLLHGVEELDPCRALLQPAIFQLTDYAVLLPATLAVVRPKG